MKRLFAAVAISALTLSTAAFAADTGAKPVDQKAQASGSSAAAPSKTMTDGAAAPAKKAETVKKSDGKASTETAPSTVKPATR